MGDTRDPAHLRELVSLISQSVQALLEQAHSGAPDAASSEPASSAGTDKPPSQEAIMVLESACAQLCASVLPEEHTMVNHALAMITPACLRVALQARMAEHLRAGPKSAAELSALSGVDAGKLGRVLRFLALRQCFFEVENGVFANTNLSECLLPDNATSALVGL